MGRFVFPVLLGIAGLAVLLGLGAWQMQRLQWKTGILAEIEAQMAAEPGPVPEAPDPATDRWLPVRAEGRLTGAEIHVLATAEGVGAGYRIIAVFESGGRRLLADLGIVPLDRKDAERVGEVVIAGNLNWPDDLDDWTPEPDLDRNIWFARDVGALSAALGTEPVLIQARRIEGADPGTRPLPVDTAAIPNDHLSYAITWFGLAIVWAAMTLFLIRRVALRGRKD